MLDGTQTFCMASFIRGFLLFGAILSALQATILHGVIQRRVVEPWVRFNARLGGRDVPAFMRDSRFQRAWAALMALLFGGLWWFTGTPTGRAWLEQGSR